MGQSVSLKRGQSKLATAVTDRVAKAKAKDKFQREQQARFESAKSSTREKIERRVVPRTPTNVKSVERRMSVAELRAHEKKLSAASSTREARARDRYQKAKGLSDSDRELLEFSGKLGRKKQKRDATIHRAKT